MGLACLPRHPVALRGALGRGRVGALTGGPQDQARGAVKALAITGLEHLGIAAQQSCAGKGSNAIGRVEQRLCSQGVSSEAPRATYDEYAGETLEEHLLAKATVEELRFFTSKGVREVVPPRDAQRQRVVGAR